MPNGRPGDHPYTDIVTYDAPLYNERIREFVKRADEYGDFGATGRARSLVWEIHREYTDEELRTLEIDLAALVEEIEHADEYAARSPLEAVLDGDESVYDQRVRTLIREIHEEIEAEIDNSRRGRKKLSELLWTIGWTPEDLNAVEAELQSFRTDHWVWEK